MLRATARAKSCAAICFLVGMVSAGTTVVGYMSVLPKWFDSRLGLALGLAGIGAGAGVGLAPFIATNLVGQFGWRGAYAGLAAIAARPIPTAYLNLETNISSPSLES